MVMHKKSHMCWGKYLNINRTKEGHIGHRISELEISRSNYTVIITLFENDCDLLKYVGLNSLRNAN